MRLAFSTSGCAEQALSASAATAARRPANPARTPGLESTGPIRAALYLRPRAAAALSRPWRRRDDAAGHALPREALARGGDERLPRGGPQVVRGLQARRARARDRPHDVVVDRNDSHSRASGGNGRGEHALTSFAPECPAEIGSTPHAAASAATMP
jgi:hypothetical protein